jgi:hypothetical protein
MVVSLLEPLGSFHFFLSPRLSLICSTIVPSSLSAASSAISNNAKFSTTQQEETTMVSKLGKLSIERNKIKSHRENLGRRKRGKQGRTKQPIDAMSLNQNAQVMDQPSSAVPTLQTRPVLSSKVRKVTAKSGLTPFLSKSVIDQRQGTRPPAKSTSAAVSLLESALASFPLVPSPPPSPQTQQSRPSKIQSSPPPIPSATYLSLATTTPRRVVTPQCLLLVLDLNGTLLSRTRGTYQPRPCLENFLDYCIENHTVLIWTSAQPHNVTPICEQLFTPEQHRKLFGVWARDTLDLTPNEFKHKVQSYKRLDRIWSNPTYALNHPLVKQGFRWSQRNTLLIDDSILKASAQPYNHIEVPEFLPQNAEAKSHQSVLSQVTAYLEEVRMWDNVSSFVRERRFQINQGWRWDWGKGGKVQA